MVKSLRGFTLVELLIVIVVIAILAGLSIVAYNGMQRRAETSVVMADVSNITKQIQVFEATHGTYPASITACPTPGENELCLDVADNLDLSYNKVDASGSGYIVNNNDSYEIVLQSERQFLYSGKVERTGGNEFMQYTDLAPYIDKYGLKEYELSFDIKSANTASRSVVHVYFQNGSTARYGGLSKDVDVTTEYVRHTIRFTPNMNNPSVANSMVAFYGNYGTGNRPIVKNLEFKLAP